MILFTTRYSFGEHCSGSQWNNFVLQFIKNTTSPLWTMARVAGYPGTQTLPHTKSVCPTLWIPSTLAQQLMSLVNISIKITLIQVHSTPLQPFFLSHCIVFTIHSSDFYLVLSLIPMFDIKPCVYKQLSLQNCILPTVYRLKFDHDLQM